jgi:hypothetical protein
MPLASGQSKPRCGCLARGQGWPQPDGSGQRLAGVAGQTLGRDQPGAVCSLLERSHNQSISGQRQADGGYVQPEWGRGRP